MRTETVAFRLGYFFCYSLRVIVNCAGIREPETEFVGANPSRQKTIIIAELLLREALALQSIEGQ